MLLRTESRTFLPEHGHIVRFFCERRLMRDRCNMAVYISLIWNETFHSIVFQDWSALQVPLCAPFPQLRLHSKQVFLFPQTLLNYATAVFLIQRVSYAAPFKQADKSFAEGKKIVVFSKRPDQSRALKSNHASHIHRVP